MSNLIKTKRPNNSLIATTNQSLASKLKARTGTDAILADVSISMAGESYETLVKVFSELGTIRTFAFSNDVKELELGQKLPLEEADDAHYKDHQWWSNGCRPRRALGC